MEIVVIISVLVLIALVSVALVIHKAFSRNRNRPVGSPWQKKE